MLRVLVALWGIAGGLFMIFIGYFTAVDWKTGESNWTTAAGLAVLGGIVVAIYSVVGAIRPTRILFLPPLILFATSAVASILLVIADFARNLASS